MIEAENKYNPDLNENLIVKISFQCALGIVMFVERLEINRKYAVAH